MRLIWVVVALLLVGCFTMQPKIGMSAAKFHKQCKNAFWKDPEVTKFANGEVIMNCKGAERPYYLFRDGKLILALSQKQVVSHFEHERCLKDGAEPGTDAYTNCRMGLAYQRAQQEAIQRQSASTALLGFSPGVLQSRQPFTPVSNTVNLQAHCTVTQIGRYTYFSCF